MAGWKAGTRPERVVAAQGRTPVSRRALLGGRDGRGGVAPGGAPGRRPRERTRRRGRCAWWSPIPPGGSTDIVGRLLAERLTALWGQPVVVENRSGAAGTVGADAVAKSAPDGHTLLVAASPEVAIARSTQRDLPYDPVRDFAAIGLLAQSPFLLLASAGLGVAGVQELIALAKDRPGALNYASFGNGTSNHFVGELFKATASVDIAHVPYRGSGPMMSDLIAGSVQLAFDAVPAGLPHVRSGRVRALGAAMLRRSPLAPEVPTFDEQGLPGFTGGTWIGLLAPARTPAAVVPRIAADLDRLRADGFSREVEGRGMAAEDRGPGEFRAFIEAEVVKWGDVARRAGIAPG